MRTRISDDYLWLPLVVSKYVAVTGDWRLLDEQVPFLTERRLEPHEESIFTQPGISGETASVYEHCCRAIQYGLKFGVHQLPLMGSGDWNDGMNRVGIDGHGESVWLAMFLIQVLRAFREVARRRAMMHSLGYARIRQMDWRRRSRSTPGMAAGFAEPTSMMERHLGRR